MCDMETKEKPGSNQFLKQSETKYQINNNKKYKALNRSFLNGEERTKNNYHNKTKYTANDQHQVEYR